MVKDLARACEDQRGGGISAVDWRGSDWRCAQFGKHRADLQKGGAVDWDASTVRCGREWTLDQSRRRAGPRCARHRLGGDHAGRGMEVDKDAAALRREDQCCEVRNGAGGGEDGEGFPTSRSFTLAKSESPTLFELAAVLRPKRSSVIGVFARGCIL